MQNGCQKCRRWKFHELSDGIAISRIFNKFYISFRRNKAGLMIYDSNLVIGAITESQQLINHALATEQKGQISMCNALEELRLEGKQEAVAYVKKYW